MPSRVAAAITSSLYQLEYPNTEDLQDLQDEYDATVEDSVEGGAEVDVDAEVKVVEAGIEGGDLTKNEHEYKHEYERDYRRDHEHRDTNSGGSSSHTQPRKMRRRIVPAKDEEDSGRRAARFVSLLTVDSVMEYEQTAAR
jgi:hypothetical protein